MKTIHHALGIVLAGSGLTIGAASCVAQEAIPVHMVVTAEAHRGPEVPEIRKEDVVVYQGKERKQVVDWTPLRGERGALQLFILLDDSSRPEIGSQFDEIRAFIHSQPPTTAIGIGYMRDGGVDMRAWTRACHPTSGRADCSRLGCLGA